MPINTNQLYYISIHSSKFTLYYQVHVKHTLNKIHMNFNFPANVSEFSFFCSFLFFFFEDSYNSFKILSDSNSFILLPSSFTTSKTYFPCSISSYHVNKLQLSSPYNHRQRCFIIVQIRNH